MDRIVITDERQSTSYSFLLFPAGLLALILTAAAIAYWNSVTLPPPIPVVDVYGVAAAQEMREKIKHRMGFEGFRVELKTDGVTVYKVEVPGSRQPVRVRFAEDVRSGDSGPRFRFTIVVSIGTGRTPIDQWQLLREISESLQAWADKTASEIPPSPAY